MTSELSDSLLERLNRGQPGAADEVVAALEPFLHNVVRRNLPDRFRGQFDSADVVQSVWVHVLHGLRMAGWQFDDPGRLRALLHTVARRRLVSRFRHHRAAAERERARAVARDRAPDPGQPRPSELAQAGELWDRMLALCPFEHHEILRLRREGLTLTEIAARTGWHEGSVRRALRQLARRLSIEAPDGARPGPAVGEGVR
jgi:RNA polymerase sigma-70 factor (ECF subfamily)